MTLTAKMIFAQASVREQQQRCSDNDVETMKTCGHVKYRTKYAIGDTEVRQAIF